jgi:hypothetical protein
VISPAQALQAVGRFDPDSSPVRKLSAVRLLGRNHYLFELANRKTFLIDMENGERLVITPEVAGAIARQVGELPSAPMTVREIRAHDAGYLRGPLPMFRVDFDDSKGTSIFVARRDGMVRYTTGALRVKNYIAGFHTFEQLELLGQQDATVKAMLHFTSVLGIVLVLSGYYLVLPRSWVRRPVQRPSSRSPAEPRR